MTVNLIIYGIRNCDTIKKARAWLDMNGHAYVFHDYRVAGVDADRLRAWVGEVGWQALLNRAGTTFRKLPEAERTDLDEARAIALMLAAPAMIRRPVLEGAGPLLVGFSPQAWAAALADSGD